MHCLGKLSLTLDNAIELNNAGTTSNQELGQCCDLLCSQVDIMLEVS